MFSYKGLTMGDLKVERNNLRRIMCDLTKQPSDYFFQLFIARVYKYLLTYTAFGAKYKHANQTELITLSLEDIIDSEYAKYYVPLQSLEQLVVNDIQNNDGSPSFERNIKSMLNDTDTYNPNDLVVYKTNIYVALVQNTGVTPGTDDSTWGIFLVSTPGQIYVGTTAPAYPVQNTVWFETSVDPLAQSTTTPLIGQFYRYNTDISDWEEMYPNVLFRWLDGFDDYTPIALYIDLDIQPNQWVNQTYTYQYPFLTANNIVNILPGQEINASQYALYNSLSLSISGTNIVLSTSLTPTIDVPLIIQIQ